MTGQELALRKAQDLVERVRADDFKQQIALALPEGTSVERFLRATVTALLQNPEIATVPDQSSLYAALVRAAQDGLVPDGRQAALVKRGDKAVYHPMIHGFHAIAADHGWSMRSQVVYANDDFSYVEEPPSIRHAPVRPGADRGPIIAAYSIAEHRDGRRMQVVLHAEDVEKRRAKATTQAVWKEWTPQMYMKSAGRALFAQLPITDRDRVDSVLAADDTNGHDAAEAFYGPGGGRYIAREASPVPLPADGAADDPARENAGGADRQAEPAAPHTSPPAVGSAPDFTEGEDDEARLLAESAGAQKVPARSKPFGARTIAQVHAEGGEDGLRFFRFALEPTRAWAREGHADHLFHTALTTYVGYFLPDLGVSESEAA